MSSNNTIYKNRGRNKTRLEDTEEFIKWAEDRELTLEQVQELTGWTKMTTRRIFKMESILTMEQVEQVERIYNG